MANPNSNRNGRAAADVLLQAMMTVYGIAKVRAAWEGVPKPVLLQAWGEALDAYPLLWLEIVAREMPHRLDAEGKREQWPPALPEVLDMLDSIGKRLRRVRHHYPELREASPGLVTQLAHDLTREFPHMTAAEQGRMLRASFPQLTVA